MQPTLSLLSHVCIRFVIVDLTMCPPLSAAVGREGGRQIVCALCSIICATKPLLSALCIVMSQLRHRIQMVLITVNVNYLFRFISSTGNEICFITRQLKNLPPPRNARGDPPTVSFHPIAVNHSRTSSLILWKTFFLQWIAFLFLIQTKYRSTSATLFHKVLGFLVNFGRG